MTAIFEAGPRYVFLSAHHLGWYLLKSAMEMGNTVL